MFIYYFILKKHKIAKTLLNIFIIHFKLYNYCNNHKRQQQQQPFQVFCDFNFPKKNHFKRVEISHEFFFIKKKGHSLMASHTLYRYGIIIIIFFLISFEIKLRVALFPFFFS